MNADWPVVQVGDIVEDVTVGHVGSMTDEYVESGIPFLRSKNIEPYRVDRSDLKFISEDFHQEISKSSLHPGDVVIVRTGDPGTAAVIPETIPRANCSDLVIIRPGDQIDERFLAYYFNSASGKGDVSARLVGSVQQHFNVSATRNVEIPLPPLPVQRRIADILGALDDKIELNRRMNETLEEMAQTLYRHWFVDFGPFQDREFKDTEELGPIPKGWEVKPIKEVVDMLGGSTPKTKVDEYWDGGTITWFTPTDLTDQDQLFLEHSDREITEEGLDSCSTNLFPPYSIMMTSRATVGVTSINRVEACTNQGFINIIPEEVSLPQVYFWIDQMMHKIEARADGSTYPEISQRDFKPLPIVVAPKEDVEEYVEQSKSLFDLIENNILESGTLAETRDYLLPKLISGEIEVEGAEEVVEEAVPEV